MLELPDIDLPALGYRTGLLAHLRLKASLDEGSIEWECRDTLKGALPEKGIIRFASSHSPVVCSGLSYLQSLPFSVQDAVTEALALSLEMLEERGTLPNPVVVDDDITNPVILTTLTIKDKNGDTPSKLVLYNPNAFLYV